MKYDEDHRQVSMIERFIDLRHRTVLEVGCGEGSLSELLARDTERYVAIDPDSLCIQRARQRPGKVDFQIGNGEALVFADASFEVVLFTLSLHHQDSRLALKEARRVLTDGGRLLVLEPAADGELQQFFHLFNDESAALEAASRAIEQSGFRLEHHEIFEVSAEFESREDLCEYPFDRRLLEASDSARILEKLQELHCSASAAEPIRLSDRIHLYSLGVTPASALAPGHGLH